MDKEKLIPSLRFSGYKDVWEQRKIGECFKERTENMPDGELLSVTINSGIKKFAELGRHDNSNEDKSKYKKVCVGDIAYNSMRMWQGASGYSPYEGIVSPAYTVLSPNEKVDSKCVSYLFKNLDMIHTFQINSQGITSDTWNLKYPALSEIYINLAKDIKEQKEIAAYFSNLDTLITLLQKEYDKLQTIKKAMLEKMFPQKGINIPEIRFEGFTEPWERRNVGEVTEELDQYTTLQSGFPLLTSSRSGLMMQNEYRDNTSTDNQDTLFSIVPLAACTYRHMSDDDIFHFNINEIVENGLVSREYPVFKASKDNNLFTIIQYLNSSPEFRAFCREQKMGGTRTRLYYKSLCRFELLLPTEKEQDQIASFIKHLDNLITLHQRKIDKLKNIKAGCLEKMFV
ncbi:type I restriction enzyme, specificity subunit (plasmid) [Peptoclostridium acidaminophilum DSM 3953]|uniref:Type I restriction enzyme, specificity subunit n=1 Tax=Peptoclostridium acidaminophilum DSM 3953 TaxID=1286171 RepID=W8TIN6_PEPAC|nr:restriction endonuclease subunit S [Peptoclostridium acidaminophilum]AHM57643.1 type I restriction enzyme, specificity subunit [Peptoclostridium acidaminophilum DSM 3953]